MVKEKKRRRIMNRNFRSTYLQTLGFHGVQDGVQVKLSLEAVLNSDLININKLSKLCVTFGIPSTYRVFVWKILLGVMPESQANADFFRENRREQYLYIRRIFCLLNSSSKLDLCGDVDENKETNAMFIANMCLLTKKQALFNVVKMNNLEPYNHIIAVASVFLEVCEKENYCDAYWCTLNLLSNSNLCKSLSSVPETCKIQIAMLEKLVATENSNIAHHFDKLNVDTTAFANGWFKSFFAESFTPVSVSRIWERVLGSPKLATVCIALSIITTLSPKLIMIKQASEIEKTLLFIPDRHTDRIIIGGVQYYEKFGG